MSYFPPFRFVCTEHNLTHQEGNDIISLLDQILIGHNYFYTPSQEQLVGWIVTGQKEQVPRECPPKFAALIAKCWEERTKRPSIEEVIEDVKEMRGEEIGLGVSSEQAGKQGHDLRNGPHYESGSKWTGRFLSKMDQSKTVDSQQPRQSGPMYEKNVKSNCRGGFGSRSLEDESKKPSLSGPRYRP